MPVKNPYSNTFIADLPEPEEIDIPQILKSFQDKAIDLICVLGPTASGKTRYAVGLAKRLETLSGHKAIILSADSRQVYRGMDIGTGKDLGEYEDIEYRLIDIADAGEKYNIYQFQHDFETAYKEIIKNGNIPILCGGSGLYIEAATQGYELPDVPRNESLRAGLEQKEMSELVEMLASMKPLHNSTDYDTKRRLIRALEIAIYQKEHPVNRTAFLPKSTYFIGTLVSREDRNAKIDKRLDARLQEGMVEEIKGLIDSGVPAEDLMYYGLEYKFVTQYILGILSLEEMRFQLGNAIHQFAKRQMTWFRGMERKGIKIHWVRP